MEPDLASVIFTARLGAREGIMNQWGDQMLKRSSTGSHVVIKLVRVDEL